MDEFELARRVLKDPPDDPGATERALARLDEAMDAPRRGHRRHSRTWLAVAAVFVALLVGTLTVVQPFGDASAGAAELRQLGGLARGIPNTSLSDGQFYFLRDEEEGISSVQNISDGSRYAYAVHDSVRTWIAADGSGYRETTYSSVHFVTPADRATWVAEGRYDIPQPGDVDTMRFAKGEVEGMDTSALSTDPVELDAQLRGDPGIKDDRQLYEEIGNLLYQSGASPQLRAALFEVAARIAGVQLIGTVTDPLGRTGIALALDDIEGRRTQLVFDPSTSNLLAIELFTIQPDGSVASPDGWTAPDPTRIVDTSPGATSSTG
jgi:hypothetical protein